MKKINLLLGLMAATLIVSAGCSKDKPPPPPQVNGVTVDIPGLTRAFENANPELRSAATQVGFNIRYTKYEDALMGLDKLANDPNVTPEQKKVVNDMIEAVKKLANSAGGAPPAQ